MKVTYPFKLLTGRNLYYISFSFKTEFKKFYDAQWGTMYSDVLYSLGDTFLSYRFKSGGENSGLIPTEYYFIDFFENLEEKEKFLNSKRTFAEKNVYKISCKPMDIKEDAIGKSDVNLVLIDNFDNKNLIFGIGTLNMKKNKIVLEVFNNYPIKLMSFCEDTSE